MTALVDHPTGAFAYLPGGTAFCNGVLASAGYGIVEWEFREPQPLNAALSRIDAEFDARGIGWEALVGVDLRSPTQFDSSGFAAFNADYVAQLRDYYPLPADELAPFTRTNITPIDVYLSEPCVRAVQVIEPRTNGGGDFVMSGVAENRGAPTPEETVAYRDTSEAGMREKVEFVAAELAARLKALGVPDTEARIVDAYTSHALDWLEPVLLGGFPSIARFGLHRWPGHPPVVDLEFELGCKRLSGRLILD